MDPPTRKKVLVCGGRDYSDYVTLCRVLGRLSPRYIIHGGCSGADKLAGQWARENKVPAKAVRAEWKRHGKSAGPRRNAEMLKENPDYVLAFPGGRGTRDMVAKAQAAGIPVYWAKAVGAG